jgi:hypothetical protein
MVWFYISIAGLGGKFHVRDELIWKSLLKGICGCVEVTKEL